MYHISKNRTSVPFKNPKKGDVKVSNVTCGYTLSSAAIELPRIPTFYPKIVRGLTDDYRLSLSNTAHPTDAIPMSNARMYFINNFSFSV